MPVKLLSEAHQLNDPTYFLNVYKWLEEHLMIPLHTDDLDEGATGDIHLYISIYREMWGEVVDMEDFS